MPSKSPDAGYSSDAPTDIDPAVIYREWTRNSRWRDKLHERAAHKALDIPEDGEMNNVGNRSGMGWKELAVIGAMVAGTGYGVAQFNNSNVTTEPAPPVASAPPDAEYEIRFFDADGNQIQLDRWQGNE